MMMALAVADAQPKYDQRQPARRMATNTLTIGSVVARSIE